MVEGAPVVVPVGDPEGAGVVPVGEGLEPVGAGVEVPELFGVEVG